VTDTVEALIRLRQQAAPQGEVFNVGSDEETTIEDLARIVIETLHSTSSIEHVPYDKAYAPGFEDMRRRRPVLDKLEKRTGFRPRTPLRRIIELTAGAVR
jgi:UDP-glucose 4-epimerase